MNTQQDQTSRVAALIRELGDTMSERLSELTSLMYQRMSGDIVPLQGDQTLLDLLYASTESNLETLVHIMRHGISTESTSPPSAAAEYARRLAQHGISSTALIRAYRLGQQTALAWAFEEFRRLEPDPAVAILAGQEFVDLTFRYVDAISEKIVHEYESERERWLSHRSTLRAAMIEDLAAGTPVPLTTAEQALGYRLRQHHVGVVLWTENPDDSGGDRFELESLLDRLAEALGAPGHPLYFARDRSVGWGWVPLGRSATLPDRVDDSLLGEVDADLRLALGSPAAGIDGFRISHLEAVSARRVALAARSAAPQVTSYADAQVRTAAMLAHDPEGTRRLVGQALGGLAANTDAAARLRETLLVFLTEQGSYVKAAERVHLHKNTVKYRVERAVEERGRPVDDERLELEIALVAARWLGPSVLRAD